MKDAAMSELHPHVESTAGTTECVFVRGLGLEVHLYLLHTVRCHCVHLTTMWFNVY